MGDPHVRVVGELADSYSDEPIIVGVDHDSVTIQLGGWPAIMLASAQVEDFAQLFIAACLEAARQSTAMTDAQRAELRAAAEEICLADCGATAHDQACRPRQDITQ